MRFLIALVSAFGLLVDPLVFVFTMLLHAYLASAYKSASLPAIVGACAAQSIVLDRKPVNRVDI